MPCRTIYRTLGHPYFSVQQPQVRQPEYDLFPMLFNFVDDGLEGLVKGIGKHPSKNCQSFASIRKIEKNEIDPVCTIIEVKEGLFTVSVPLGKDAKAENLDVKVKDRDVLIEIKTEKTSEDGTSTLNQIFTKKVSLPEEANVDEVKSRLTTEGVLKIEAPLPVPEKPKEAEAIEIPVTMETEDDKPRLETEETN